MKGRIGNYSEQLSDRADFDRRRQPRDLLDEKLAKRHFVENLSSRILDPCLAPQFALILQVLKDLTRFKARGTIERPIRGALALLGGNATLPLESR